MSKFSDLRWLVGFGLSLLMLGGCMQDDSLSFAPLGQSGSSPHKGVTQASFFAGDVVLEAPLGFCFDPDTLRADDSGGFAILAKCHVFNGTDRARNWRDLGLITATVAPMVKGQTPPDLEALTAAIPHAKILKQREDLLLPVVNLSLSNARAQGASPDHWRGAFIVHDHLVALALYAPDQGRLLRPKGALVLEDMARRSLARSLEQDVAEVLSTQTNAAAVALPQVEAQRTDTGRLRPRARPTARATTQTDAASPDRKKLSLSKRIAGLFH